MGPLISKGHNMHRLIFVAVAAALLSAGASALERKDSKDPNRIVCEKQGVLGSRLASKRVCMSAAEWAAQRAAERQAIDKTQILQKGPSGN